jgi:hypothetical protein
VNRGDALQFLECLVLHTRLLFRMRT